ncbi:unnamed protein product [Paramecium sonneborni]|uniref:Uncharacterized protein n=1 Tax=Paramecium sonneborni TaxID=65129 RepID=A0A8S1RUT6_9CILI|nr:unnamed protein product [Paramecium sonneborni]
MLNLVRVEQPKKLKFIWQSIIPIYVSQPYLKNLKYNLFEQALQSDNYGFDKHQIEYFKETIQNKKELILMILDNYDEMKQDCIQQNLILNNKFNQDLNIYKLQRQLIWILNMVLCRDSVCKVFKEIQLQNFDQDQIQEEISKMRNIRQQKYRCSELQKLRFKKIYCKKVYISQSFQNFQGITYN